MEIKILTIDDASSTYFLSTISKKLQTREIIDTVESNQSSHLTSSNSPNPLDLLVGLYCPWVASSSFFLIAFAFPFCLSLEGLPGEGAVILGRDS